MRALTPYYTGRILASDLFDGMDRFFEEWKPQPASLEPAWEITETENNFLMSVDLPGMKKEEIKIEVVDSRLNISGERKRGEKSYGSFNRTFALPSTVDTQKVEARYENGVLELLVPKSQAAKPRTIEVQSGHLNLHQDVKDIPSTKVS